MNNLAEQLKDAQERLATVKREIKLTNVKPAQKKINACVSFEPDLLEKLRAMHNYSAFINETLKMRLNHSVKTTVMSREVELFGNVNLDGFEIILK
jgi:hypothetical protein